MVDAQVSSRHSRLSLSDVDPLEATCRVQKSDSIPGAKKKIVKARRRVSRLGWYSIGVTVKAVSSSSNKFVCLLLLPVQF